MATRRELIKDITTRLQLKARNKEDLVRWLPVIRGMKKRQLDVLVEIIKKTR